MLSDGDIDFPNARNVDSPPPLTQESFDKHHKDLRSGGFLIVDSDAVPGVHETARFGRGGPGSVGRG